MAPAAILAVRGYETEVVHSGPEALEEVEQPPFDCVLSHIGMPEVSGVELYRAIKARQLDLPVVLMTAYSTDDLVQEGLEEGALAALTKPLDIGWSVLSRSWPRSVARNWVGFWADVVCVGAKSRQHGTSGLLAARSWLPRVDLAHGERTATLDETGV